jgi:uncharacterized peroxidase-related enzyme
MHSFSVPTREQVSANNQAIFDTLQKNYGQIPNLLAMFAYSETALGDFISFVSRKSSLSQKEKEAINLIVSQVNNCKYCLRAHTMAARSAGFNDEQIIAIRKAAIPFDNRLHALVQFAEATVSNKGRPSEAVIDSFFEAGYTEAALVDAIMTIAGKTISNFLHNITEIPIDWPEIPEI